jgi:predicted O-methyltransferase YrrM
MLKALLASHAKPNEIYNYLCMHAALAADRVLTRAPAYSPIDWSTALLELERYYPEAARFLQEQELADVEEYTRIRSRAISAEGAALALNSDPSFARCLYLICRTLIPTLVVETGVAYGMSSAFILQALAVNGCGMLHSVDLPLPSYGSSHLIGSLVRQELRDRWHLHLGASKQELLKIVHAETVDVFVHDSLHTYRNMRSEFQVAWPHVRAGGIVVSDDVEGNRAFEELLDEEPRYWQVVRQEHKRDSLFGIAIHR